MKDQNKNIFENLLTKYISGTIIESELDELFDLIMKNDIYRKEYEEIAKTDALLHIPYLESKKVENYELIKKTANANIKKQRGVIPIWGNTLKRVAAAVLLIIASSTLSITIYNNIAKKNYLMSSIIEIGTPLGGQTKINLPDGSVAWLNAKSEIKYNSSFGQSDRNIALTGEGYFEVYKNDKLPFTINTNGLKVIATGTKFNVKAYIEDSYSEICLIEGGIDILTPQEQWSLKPNEKAEYNKENKKITVRDTEAYRAALWTKGRVSFEQASLTEIIKDLERKFNIEIQIESKYLKDEYFWGSINMDMDIYEILKYIDVDKKYQIERRGGSIIIKDKK